jgi:hypothetical protein
MGYAINLPTGWKRIEKETLKKSFKELSVSLPNAKLDEAVDGFQPESSEQEPGPHIIVTVSRVGRTSFKDLQEMGASLQGFQSGADSAYRGNSLKASSSVDSASYDEQGHFLRITSTASVPGFGNIRGTTVVFPMDYGLLEFQFFSTERDYNQYSALFSSIIRSIRKTVPANAAVGTAPAEPSKRLLTDDEVGLVPPLARGSTNSLKATPISTSPASQALPPTASSGEKDEIVGLVILAALACLVVSCVIWALWLYFTAGSKKRLPPLLHPTLSLDHSNATEYFILQNNETEGPYSLEELRSLWNDGTLMPSVPKWTCHGSPLSGFACAP